MQSGIEASQRNIIEIRPFPVDQPVSSCFAGVIASQQKQIPFTRIFYEEMMSLQKFACLHNTNENPEKN